MILNILSFNRIIKVSWMFSNFSVWMESLNSRIVMKISKTYHYVINLDIADNFHSSLHPAYPGSCVRGSIVAGELRNLGCTISVDPWVYYLKSVSTGHNWTDNFKVSVFCFHQPTHFIHSTIKISTYYFVFISLIFISHIKKTPPMQLFPERGKQKELCH